MHAWRQRATHPDRIVQAADKELGGILGKCDCRHRVSKVELLDGVPRVQVPQQHAAVVRGRGDKRPPGRRAGDVVDDAAVPAQAAQLLPTGHVPKRERAVCGPRHEHRGRVPARREPRDAGHRELVALELPNVAVLAVRLPERDGPVRGGCREGAAVRRELDIQHLGAVRAAQRQDGRTQRTGALLLLHERLRRGRARAQDEPARIVLAHTLRERVCVAGLRRLAFVGHRCFCPGRRDGATRAASAD